ncbi:MAG: hypothetical protein HY303_19105 [Candidatus Wallbacteria bacterium]|nr:hypothetical protein [Candidatus Wallbacteria bacterium]
MAKEFRRSYLIRRRFQTKLILRLSLMILVTSAMVALIFVGSRYYVAVKTGDPHHFDVLDELGGLFFEVLVWWLLGYLAAFAYFALRFSHEIAGPLYRFEKALLDIAEDGRLGAEIHLRDEDDPEFHHLASLFNRALGRMRESLDRARGICGELRKAGESAPEAAVRPEVLRACDSLEETLARLGEAPQRDEKQTRLVP